MLAERTDREEGFYGAISTVFEVRRGDLVAAVRLWTRWGAYPLQGVGVQQPQVRV